MKRVRFVYNPRSGDRKIVNEIDKIIKIYQSRGYVIEPYRININESLDKAFHGNMEEVDHILISGGDGTIDSVVNAMRKKQISLPIGILPSGTANDFASTLNIPQNVDIALKNILERKYKNIDLGKINDRYFVNVASAGMFTDVSQRINSDLKNSLGKVSYYIKGIEDAMNMKKFHISVKSEEICYHGEMYLILIFNGKTAGNINLAYKSKIDDGVLDVIIFKSIPIQKSLKLLIKVIRQEHLEHEKDIIYFRTKKVEISCRENIVVDIDGEKGPSFPITIECIKDGLEVLGI